MNESIGIIPIGLSMQDLSNQKQVNFSDKVRNWLISNNYHLLNPTPFLSTRNNEPLSPPNSDENWDGIGATPSPSHGCHIYMSQYPIFL